MTWGYNATVPTDLDKVRLLVGDTNSDDQQMQNEEIQYLIEAEGSVQRAAARCAQVIAAKYARMVDKEVGDLRIAYSQRQAAYEQLAEDLVSSATTASLIMGTPSAGGVYVAEKDAAESDDTLVQPYFKRGIHDFD